MSSEIPRVEAGKVYVVFGECLGGIWEIAYFTCKEIRTDVLATAFPVIN